MVSRIFFTDAVFQFFCCGDGVGDHEDIVYGKSFFEDQAQEKPGNGIRLPRPRAGLNKVRPLKRTLQEVETLDFIFGAFFAAITDLSLYYS